MSDIVTTENGRIFFVEDANLFELDYQVVYCLLVLRSSKTTHCTTCGLGKGSNNLLKKDVKGVCACCHCHVIYLFNLLMIVPFNAQHLFPLQDKGWFNRKCRKLNHSKSFLSNFLPAIPLLAGKEGNFVKRHI